MLGPLELQVMEVIWGGSGDSSVRDVAERIERKLAYTTVMTTLDRLFKKGMLNRHKAERAFLYSSRISRESWELRRAGDLVAGLLAGSGAARELLLSSLVDAVGQHDTVLLDELEQKIQEKRKEVLRRANA
jgi:predicted transcriptional regulator